MDNNGEPLRTGKVSVQIVGPAGRADSVQLAAAGEDSWGLFTGTFIPEEGGAYTLTTTCLETGATLETSMSVQGLQRERVGQPARFDVLREISEISRGKLTQLDEVGSLVKELSDLPEPELMVRRFRIWSHPLWGALLVVLLAGFWSARKIAGLA